MPQFRSDDNSAAEASGDCAAVIKLRLASAAAGHEAGEEEEEGKMTFSKNNRWREEGQKTNNCRTGDEVKGGLST